MNLSSCFRLTTSHVLLGAFCLILARFGSATLVINAAPPKVFAQSRTLSASLPSGCGIWNVVSSPNPGTSENILNRVTAVSTTDAWGVGFYFNNNAPNPLQTLIENWDGTNWNVITSPNVGSSNNDLNGVAALSVNDVWAVGYFTNGSNIQQTLTEHWDGSSWSVVSSPNAGTYSNILNGITEVPGSNQLWAVGYFWDSSNTYLPLIEHWDGSSWSIVPNPNPGRSDDLLNGVAALSVNNAWAVGTSNNIRAGQEQTLTEHWDGTTWSIVRSPNLSNNGYFHAVAYIPGSRKLWAVGFYNNTNRSYETLTEYWNGKKWKIISSPNPNPIGPSTVVTLQGVTAFSAKNVWTVGFYQY